MADPTSPPKKKKLPFKPTALRRNPAAAPTISASSSFNDLQNTQGSDDGGTDDLALFQRRREMAPRLASDLERRLKKKQEQQLKAESERRRSSGGEKRHHEDEPDEDVLDGHLGDNPLVSPDDDVDHTASSSFERTRHSHHGSSDPVTSPPSKRSRNADQDSIGHHRQHSSPIIALSDADIAHPSPFSRTTRSQTKAHPPPEVAPIVLSDSDSELPYHAVKPPFRRVPPPREPSIEIRDPADEDDEFNEYVVKAAAARAHLQAQQDSSTSNNQNTTTSTKTNSSSPPPHAEILVTSSLPDSIPCKALVRFDQSLRLLRDSWAAKQRKAGLDVPESSAILTWRRARVYNTSTLIHLGLRPGVNGRITVSDGGTTHRSMSRTYSSTTDDGLSEDRTRVHFEAWTPATFAEMERDEALRNVPQPSSPLHNSRAQEVEEEEEEVKLRVILRARDLEDVRLTVRPATTGETLASGFRRQLADTKPEVLSANPSITLWFDGEQLEEHVTLEEADITDKDIIEVHLKAA